MSAPSPNDRPRTLRAAPRSAQVSAGLLLAVPVLAVLLVPIYSRSGPELGGWPFFYWYQVAWVLLCALFPVAAAVVLRRGGGGGRCRRMSGRGGARDGTARC